MSAKFVVKMSLIVCLLHYAMANQTLANATTALHNATGNPMAAIKTKNVIVLVVFLLLFVVSMVGGCYVTSSDFTFRKSVSTETSLGKPSRCRRKQKTCCEYVPMVQPDDADVEADPLLP